MGFEVISARQLKSMAGKKEYIIVDLRPYEEYKRHHVNGAVNYSYDNIERGKYNFPKSKTIVFYCERGATSFLAARKLHDNGYNTCTVVGGYSAISK